MDQQSKTLISFLTRRWKKPEEEQQARELLSEIMEDREVEIHERGLRIWKWVVWLVAAAVMVWAAQPIVNRAFRMSEKDLGGLITIPMMIPILSKGLTDHEKQILGNFEPDAVELKKQLHLSAPDNPSYFLRYALAYQQEHDDLPEGYLRTAEQVDPENAFFLYYAAGTIGSGCYDYERVPTDDEVKRDKNGRRLPRRPTANRYEVIDIEEFEKASRLIEQAFHKPSFSTYSYQHLSDVVRVLDQRGERSTFQEVAMSMYIALGNSSSGIQQMTASRLISAAADQAANAGNQEEFLKWVKIRNKFLGDLSSNDEPFLLDALVYQAVVGSAADFECYSKVLEMSDLEQVFKEQVDLYHALRLKNRRRDNSDLDHVFEKAGFIHQVLLPVMATKADVSIDEKDLRPLREAEHYMLSRLSAKSIGFVLLLMAGGAAVLRRVLPYSIRKSAAQSVALLNTRDWLWMVLLGVLLPVGLHFFMIQLTALSGRSLGVQSYAFVYPCGLMLSMMAIMVLSSVVLIHRRLIKRIPLSESAHLPSRVPIVLLLVTLFIVLVGFVIIPAVLEPKGLTRSEVWILGMYALPSGVLLIGAVWSIVAAVRGTVRTRFLLAATASVLPILFAVATTAVCLTAILYKQKEIHCIAQD